MLYRHCGNAHLARALRQQVHGTFWSLVWRDQPMDFLTAPRRREAVSALQGVLDAAQRGAEAEAERLARWLLLTSRDHALEALRAAWPGTVDPSKRIAPDAEPAGVGIVGRTGMSG